MATIGLSKAYFAKYSNSGSTVTYSDGGIIGKAISVDIEVETSDDNTLYADNAPAESETSFAGGTLTVGTDELSQEASKAILGIKEQALDAIEGVTDEDAKELIYDDDQSSPYLGYGCIIMKKVRGQYRWRAVVLTKIQFATPTDSATTKGSEIEWQTPELSATIMRDDTAKHAWKREATFTTEGQADAYIMHILGITAAPTTASEESET